MPKVSLLRVGLLALLVTGCGGSDDAEPSAPTLPEGLSEGWNEIKPGGESICSRGTEFAYFVHPGTVNKVVVDFIGGGACWNEFTCSVGDAIFSADIENVRAEINGGVPRGIYDRENPENPFKDWYHVIIPYCTGDVHWGDSTTTYAEGTANEVTINHRGAVNARAVLDWVGENFSQPEQLFVTGCSAGSYGSIMWAPHLMQMYPKTRVVQFGDSGAGVITEEFFRDSFPAWKAEGAFPAWIPELNPAENDLLEKELGDLYTGIGDFYADSRLSQYNTTFDENQTFYYSAMGGEGGAEAWSGKMLESVSGIEAASPNFRAYQAPGEQHCIIVFDNFYDVTSNGVRLVDWVRDLAEGTDVPSVHCQGAECEMPTPGTN